ncbi:MAG TPA: SAM-dependent methyltransferase [Planctomycetaceae bacterium]|nr:SAM-dependent methyltransferase [Planctomycetaceae bacterium]HRF02432.1 class I SAM-dependent methyltransferase [Pirellulaceae bacterium]
MDRRQLESTFDDLAETYDQQWAKLGAFRDGMHLLMAAILSALPRDARMLCVGAGTGAEIHFLADRFPEWSFVAVEPSAGMVDVATKRAVNHGYASRCTFHTGYLDSLDEVGRFDGACSLLVSQFLLDERERIGFFAEIAARLKPGGLLVTADLVSDVSSEAYGSLLEVWLRTMAASDVPADRLSRMREAYARDVAIVSAERMQAIVASAGFSPPVPFYQAGLIHAFYCRRLSDGPLPGDRTPRVSR